MSADVLDFRTWGQRIRGPAWAEAYQAQHDRRFFADQRAAYEAEILARRQREGLRPLASVFDDWASSGFPDAPPEAETWRKLDRLAHGENLFTGDRPPAWDTPGFGRRRRDRDALFGGPDGWPNDP